MMLRPLLISVSAFWLFLLVIQVTGDEDLKSREKRQIGPSIFTIMRFKNDPCTTGTGKNGTCYTKEECKEKGGSGSVSCASGYGICCVFSISCGGTASENCTYLVQSTTSTSASMDPCDYKICKANDDICRIRLDFETFVIANPSLGTSTTGAGQPASLAGPNIGDCITDSFGVSSPGNRGSPIICGTNTGQHMFIDASDACAIASFDIGPSGTTREWSIKVTQYECGDTNGGPDGCLQYFMGDTGTIRSFNYPAATTTSPPAETTHLSNQRYKMCVRREANKCSICYIPSIAAATAPAQASFGLSVSAQAPAAESQVGSNCNTDYLLIPSAQGAPVTLGTVPGTAGRICGRFFNTETKKTVSISICSQFVPFSIMFNSDSTEATSTIADTKANEQEQNKVPGGIIGFALDYVQGNC